MSMNPLMRSFLPHGSSGPDHFIMELLMGGGEDESLAEEARRIDRETRLSEEMREELKKLMAYRAFYDAERKARMSPEVRKAVSDYDWEWTLELAQRMYGFVPEPLIGKRPMPPKILAMMPPELRKSYVSVGKLVPEAPVYSTQEPKEKMEAAEKKQTYAQTLQKWQVLNGPAMMPTMRSPRTTDTTRR